MCERMSITDFSAFKRDKRKIVMVSCFDYTTARYLESSDVDSVLVGDSAAQVMLGHKTTLPAGMDFMVTITQAVRRGAPHLFLIADMPFLSHQISPQEAVRNAGRFMVECEAQMVKMEVSLSHLDRVKAVSQAGIPVMSHIGIKPQMICKMGGYHAVGVCSQEGRELIQFSERLVEAGSSALLVEGVTAEVSAIITERCEVPVISCGSGPQCDGQVLIASDILGLTIGKKPRFALSFERLGELTVKAFSAYSRHVREGVFPGYQHCYHIKQEEKEGLERLSGAGRETRGRCEV